jgi:hypothetical protein
MAKVALTLFAIGGGLLALILLVFCLITVYEPDMPPLTQALFELLMAAFISSTAFLGFLFITHHKKH